MFLWRKALSIDGALLLLFDPSIIISPHGSEFCPPKIIFMVFL
jgi:hypothetical protein